MGAVDPSYPLYPIACVLASTGTFLVLLTSFIRQNWNLGVAFLCFWLFLENIAGAVNTITWADNADVKLYVLCDISMDFLCQERLALTLPFFVSIAPGGASIHRQAHVHFHHHTPTLHHHQAPIRGSFQSSDGMCQLT